MPSHNCAHPTCNTILPAKGYCPQHLPLAIAPAANYDRYQRDPWSKRFYNSTRWKKTRDSKLARDPLCQEPGCQNLADLVHHKKPVKQIRFTNPHLLFAAENLESVCNACHNRIEKSGLVASATRSSPCST